MKKIEFEPPPALKNVVGENVKSGQKLELMGTFQVKEDGDWCLVEVEGVAMPGYDDQSGPGESEYVRSAVENMPRPYAAS